MFIKCCSWFGAICFGKCRRMLFKDILPRSTSPMMDHPALSALQKSLPSSTPISSSSANVLISEVTLIKVIYGGATGVILKDGREIPAGAIVLAIVPDPCLLVWHIWVQNSQHCGPAPWARRHHSACSLSQLQRFVALSLPRLQIEVIWSSISIFWSEIVLRFVHFIVFSGFNPLDFFQDYLLVASFRQHSS